MICSVVGLFVFYSVCLFVFVHLSVCPFVCFVCYFVLFWFVCLFVCVLFCLCVGVEGLHEGAREWWE